MQTVYLAGPIAGCTDAENHDWRNTVKLALGGKFKFLDPTDRDTRKIALTDDECINLVESDIRDIKRSDIILAHVWKTSAGTSMEFVYAKKILYKTVIAICPGEYLSPWVFYHSDWVVRSLDEAIRRLERLIDG